MLGKEAIAVFFTKQCPNPGAELSIILPQTVNPAETVLSAGSTSYLLGSRTKHPVFLSKLDDQTCDNNSHTCPSLSTRPGSTWCLCLGSTSLDVSVQQLAAGADVHVARVAMR